MTDNRFTVRFATLEDIPILIQLIQLVFSIEKDFNPDEAKQECALKMLLDSPSSARIFVALDQEKVIGMCSAQLLISTAEGGRKALLEDVAVLPDYQRSGVGRNLLTFIESWAKENEIKRLDLVADLDNLKALNFYQKIGWHQTNLLALQKAIKI